MFKFIRHNNTLLLLCLCFSNTLINRKISVPSVLAAIFNMKHQINNTNRDHTADYIYKTSYGTCILDDLRQYSASIPPILANTRQIDIFRVANSGFTISTGIT